MRKDDNMPATKGEFRGLRSEVRVLGKRVDRIEENMLTKKDGDMIMNALDAVMTELAQIRMENAAFHARFERNDDTLQDHEKRIGVLEKAR